MEAMDRETSSRIEVLGTVDVPKPLRVDEAERLKSALDGGERRRPREKIAPCHGVKEGPSREAVH